jgi:hypothetical protein
MRLRAGLGSCGWTNNDSEMVAAAPAALYDILGDSICGQHVTLNLGGNSVNVRIVDKCPVRRRIGLPNFH